jgi:hypothetical protein
MALGINLGKAQRKAYTTFYRPLKWSKGQSPGAAFNPHKKERKKIRNS